MVITPEMFQAIIAWAVWRTSRALGIIDADDALWSPEEAIASIMHSPAHSAALIAFADAYGDWYAYHLKIFNAGQSGNLTHEQNAEVVRLIGKRDATRQALLAIT